LTVIDIATMSVVKDLRNEKGWMKRKPTMQAIISKD
jgi:hypothetical protein